jgi:hypothetical protein
MKINRHNYEEYFILYADNELGSEERQMVEEFANLNPDLKDELDTYLNTVLLPDTFVGFENKEELHRYDESLISYIDNELPAAEKTEFEKLVNATPSLQTELELYRKTKLQPEMDIVFENKSVLYRSTERRVVRMTWVRWAAAAAILLAVSITAITVSNKTKETGPIAKSIEQIKEDVAEIKIDKKGPEIPVTLADNSKKDEVGGLEKQPSVAKKTDLLREKKANQKINNDEKKDVIASNNEKTPSNNLPEPENKTSTFIASVDPIQKQKTVNGLPDASVDVTNRQPSPYKYAGGPQIADDSDGTINPDEDGGQNKKSRGLFRKLTRVFEKTTGMKATTDDDKLHIAAFTVKLK